MISLGNHHIQSLGSAGQRPGWSAAHIIIPRQSWTRPELTLSRQRKRQANLRPSNISTGNKDWSARQLKCCTVCVAQCGQPVWTGIFSKPSVTEGAPPPLNQRKKSRSCRLAGLGIRGGHLLIGISKKGRRGRRKDDQPPPLILCPRDPAIGLSRLHLTRPLQVRRRQV